VLRWTAISSDTALVAERFGEGFDAALAAAASGEGWAFERLFGWLGRDVAAYARGAGVDDPDGTANEVFLRVFRGIGTFDGSEDKFRSWVFAIAHNRIIDERRRRSRRPAEVPASEAPEVPTEQAPDAADLALGRLGDDRLRLLLDGLSPEQREVLLLRVVADLSIEDTARALGKRPGAVKALQHRAIRSLRAKVEGVTP
jgi:RNA polymerase sigma factor (sigma-70 family)